MECVTQMEHDKPNAPGTHARSEPGAEQVER